MKNVFVICVCLGLLGLASCAKDHVCNCTYSNADPPINGDKHIDLSKTTPKTAREYCDNEEAQLASTGYDSYNCELSEVE